MRFDRDPSWRRFGTVVVAGSPLTVFRTTPAAAPTLDALEAGDDVAPSRLTDRLLRTGAIHPRPAAGPGNRFDRGDVTVVTPQLGGRPAQDGRLVVDDGSTPPLRGATIRLATNRGPAAARNAGRELVTTPLVAFVDADVDLLGSDATGAWLDRLLPHFDDTDVGLVAPRVAGDAGSSLDLGAVPARIEAGTRVGYVPAAAIVARVAAFDDVGGFDERLRVGEDVDFVWRLADAGWTCRYEPGSVVRHEPRPTRRARFLQQVRYGSSAAPLALRHPHRLAPVRVNTWTAVAWGAAVAGHPLVGAGIALGSAAAFVPQLRIVPAPAAFGLALRGHLGAARQFVSALRRPWWPLAALGALRSRRLRLVAAAAIAVDVRAVPRDIAHGWGIWTGVVRHRTLAPLAPQLSAWPGRLRSTVRGAATR